MFSILLTQPLPGWAVGVTTPVPVTWGSLDLIGPEVAGTGVGIPTGGEAGEVPGACISCVSQEGVTGPRAILRT